MYESPIEKIVGEVTTQMIQDEENRLMCEVRQTIGYNIDKEELLKALQYDRGQYEKGYADGVTSATKTGHWIKLNVGYGCSECSLATNEYGKNDYKYCPNCGAKMEE